jgi:hypothetical protein
MMLIHGSNKKKQMYCKFFETNDRTLVSKNLRNVGQPDWSRLKAQNRKNVKGQPDSGGGAKKLNT